MDIFQQEMSFVLRDPQKYNAGIVFIILFRKGRWQMVRAAGGNLVLSHYLVMVGIALVVLGVAFYWLPATRVKAAALGLALLGGLTAGAALCLLAFGGAGLARKPIRVDLSKRGFGPFPDNPFEEGRQFRRQAEQEAKKPRPLPDPMAARRRAFEETPDPPETSLISLRDQLQKAADAGRLNDPELMKIQKGDMAKTQVLRLRTTAILSDGKQKFCFVKRDKEIEQRELEIGLSDDSYTEVNRGLQEGESVIANPKELARRLTEGAENRAGQ